MEIQPAQVQLPVDIGEALAQLRASSRKSQSEVASAISVDASRISRIENRVFEPTPDEVLGILAAIGSPESSAYRDYLVQSWTELPRPAFEHPDRATLHKAELALGRLRALEETGVSPLVAVRLQFLRDQLHRAAEHLSRMDYHVAFVGQIAVGKTTFICVLADLVLGTGINDGAVVLETGKGRITICDVEIARGHRVGLVVEPYSSDEVYELARDFCEGLWSREIEAEEGHANKGVSQEIERALRCMASLPRPRRPKRVEGREHPPTPQDPAKALAESAGNLDAFIAEFCQRLGLPNRTERELWVPPGDSELEWIAKQFRAVNNGRNPRVSLPRRIRVLLPRAPFDAQQYALTVVDTKGLDDNAVRPDLREHRDDERTLLVLCSRFEDAPSSAGQTFIEQGVAEGAEQGLLERSVLLVLPRSGEAEEMKDDSGFTVEDVEDGYELRGDQVATELAKLGMSSLPVRFANSSRPLDVASVREGLIARIRGIRDGRVGAIKELALAVADAEENHEEQAAQAAHERVREDIRVFVQRHRELTPRRQPVQARLRDDIDTAHARSVWAMTRRNGSWWKLNAPAAVGAGAVLDARSRSQEAFAGLREILSNQAENPVLEPAHAYIRTLIQSIPQWERDFYAEVREAGTLTYRVPLAAASDLWHSCERRYGLGSGFRSDVRDRVSRWFDEPARAALLDHLDRKVATAWAGNLIAPLRDQIGDGDGASSTGGQ